ncbi:MAG: hypothetical protein MI919_02365 [Holophagales bacterium]|nr:hypothetical protein [Holophagales bacterium]
MKASRPSLIRDLLPAVLLALVIASPAAPEITIESRLEARILLDNSASMFPGYAPPGRSGPTLAESGGRYYVQYPELAGWVNDFVAAQTILGVRSVSLAAFTSTGAFEPSDVRFLHRSSPLASFDLSRIRGQLPPPGKHTYLAESLQQATRGFEGILWLITDNIVEDRRGVPDEGVARFFRTLADRKQYRSIHLFKLPFADLVRGKPGNLAIYGILVSPRDVDGNVQRYFDNKLRGDFLRAPRRGSAGSLFPHKAYWKLKDLSVGALELEVRPTLEVEIVQQDRNLFRERKMVHLSLQGSVTSRLTQHRVTAGSFRIVPRGPFRPEGKAGEDYGLEEVPADHFEGRTSSLPRIPPRQSVSIQAELRSNRPIPLETRGLGAWLRSASRGLQVTYRGQAEARFQDLVAEFDRSQMAGIFGADIAPEIFRIPTRIVIDDEISNTAPIEFQLTSGYGRQLLFVLLFLLFAALAVGAYFFLFRTAKYRVAVGGNERILALQRGRARHVEHQGVRLGRLRRTITGASHFEPNRRSAGLEVKPSGTRGRYDVTLRDQGNLVLEIAQIGGGPVGPMEARSPGRGGSRPASKGIGRPGAHRPDGGRGSQNRMRIFQPGADSRSPGERPAAQRPARGGRERPADRPPSRPSSSRPTIGRPR